MKKTDFQLNPINIINESYELAIYFKELYSKIVLFSSKFLLLFYFEGHDEPSSCIEKLSALFYLLWSGAGEEVDV